MPGRTPHGRHRDVASADAKALRIVEDGQDAVERRPVEQRLTHPHEHDVRREQWRIEQRELAHLTGDLERLEVPRKAHEPRRAERAAQGATRLRRETERQAIALGDRDGLDLLPVVKAEEKLLGSVGGALSRRDLETRKREPLVQLGPKRLRQVAHLAERRDRRLPQSSHDLRGPVRRLPALERELAHRVGGRARREIEKVRFHRKIPLSTTW
jgi:hypothetical protein